MRPMIPSCSCAFSRWLRKQHLQQAVVVALRLRNGWLIFVPEKFHQTYPIIPTCPDYNLPTLAAYYHLSFTAPCRKGFPTLENCFADITPMMQWWWPPKAVPQVR